MTRRFLSIPEVAEYFGLSQKTVQNQLSLGKFPIRFVKIGRLTKFDLVDVESYADSLMKYGGKNCNTVVV